MSQETPAPAPTDVPAEQRVSEADIQALAEQLGRPPRGVHSIAARCVCGRPAVVRTLPRLDDGTPFPTTLYLTHPGAVKAMSTLEAEHTMEDLKAELAASEEMRAAYERAHAAYLSDRAALGEVPEIAGVSAGGMPTRIKCLHALAGHALAAGEGVNPVGDRALEIARQRGLWDKSKCSCE